MGLSVVVTVVDGGGALGRCLDALAGQQGAEPLDIIVPWDAGIPDVGVMAARCPGVRFLDLAALATQRPATSPAGQHELYDRRRAAGLAAARGDLVAILEDRGVPRPDWAATFRRLHTALPHAVIGGAVEHGRGGILNWAVYFCDFSRYQPPFDAGTRPYVTDVNVCYKRRALDATRDLWAARYHETTVHWALLRAGETLYLSPEPVVEQHRDDLSLGPLLRERFGWGRLFAYTRARELSRARRFMLAALAPILPALLAARMLRDRLRRGRSVYSLLVASPAIIVLLAAWSAGECLGYLSGEA